MKEGECVARSEAAIASSIYDVAVWIIDRGVAISKSAPGRSPGVPPCGRNCEDDFGLSKSSSRARFINGMGPSHGDRNGNDDGADLGITPLH